MKEQEEQRARQAQATAEAEGRQQAALHAKEEAVAHANGAVCSNAAAAQTLRSCGAEDEASG